MLRDNIMKYRGCSREEIICSYQQRLDEYLKKAASGDIFIDCEGGRKDVPGDLKRERDGVLRHYGFELPNDEGRSSLPVSESPSPPGWRRS